MIRIATKTGLLGEGEVQWREAPWRPGVTVRDLVAAVGMFSDVPVLVGVDGQQLEDHDEVPDGSTVVICMATGDWIVTGVVYAVISAIVGLAVNYVVGLLTPTHKPPGLPQERGDASSPTYTWNGIQTSYGQGLPIPVVLGRHMVGGQAIYTRVVPNALGTSLEALTVVLVLSEGPVQRIGQYVGSRNRLGALDGGPAAFPIPDGLFIDDSLQVAQGGSATSPPVMAWTRPGTLFQSPLPASEFPGASTSFAVQRTLLGAAEFYEWTYSVADDIGAAHVLLEVPNGCYEIGSGGSIIAYPLRVRAQWRPAGQTAWNEFSPPADYTLGFGITSAFSWTIGGLLHPSGSLQRGPIQIRTIRETPTGNPVSVISSLIWRSVELQRPQELAYPGCALLGLYVRATGQRSGGFPQFKQLIDGVLVRVWDEDDGFSPPCWDPPPAPWDFCTMPPGRNPAWVLGEFLTNRRWGLGREFSDADVDWPALRRWAAFCQAVPTGWSEPGFQVGLVLDAQRPAWEVVIQICQAGRAAPVWRNGKISVVYQYRDAHGDGGITVPAKVPVQLITSALCENVQVRWLPKHGRATSIDFQFLDEEQAFAQVTMTQEDEEASINDPSDPNAEPYIVQVMQAYGVTRQSQLRRHGFYLHRVTRLIRRELTFECGPWMLAAEVGDLFDFQHDLLRPWGDFVATAMQVCQAVVDDNRVLVDHAVPDPTGLAFAARAADGTPVYRGIEAVTPSTYRGRPATLLLLAGDNLNLAAGATAILGKSSQLVQTYQVVSISLAQNMRRVVRAVQWAPEVFDPVPVGSAPFVATLLAPSSGITPSVAGVRLTRTDDGRLRVSWTRVQDDALPDVPTRVWVRSSANASWSLIGETLGTTVDLPTAFGDAALEVAVTPSTVDGWVAPEATAAATVAVPEWPNLMLPAPSGVSARVPPGTNRLEVRWRPVTSPDVISYEIRVGDDWSAGRIVWAGSGSAAAIEPAPAHSRLQVAARHVSGLFGQRAMLDVPVTGVPWPGAGITSTLELAPTDGSPTHSGTEFVSGRLQLAAGVLQGTVTSPAVDLGFQAVWFLRLAWSAEELDGRTLEEAGDELGSGEGWWATMQARPASPRHPGVNWELTFDDVPIPFESAGELLCSGLARGEPGSHVRCDLESRVFVDGAWSAWERHEDGERLCSQWQVRALLGRRDARRDIRITTFRLEALI